MFSTLKELIKNKTARVAIASTFAGWGVAFLATPILPEILSIAIPAVTTIAGVTWTTRSAVKKERLVKIATTQTIQDSSPDVDTASEKEPEASSWARDVSNYTGLLSGMLSQELQNNNIDREIVDKVHLVLTKISHLIPSLEEYDMADIKHKIQRLVMQDLNSVIVPFIKLPVQEKINNRRRVLNSIKDIDGQLDIIMQGFQQRDKMDFETGIQLISKRYNKDVY